MHSRGNRRAATGYHFPTELSSISWLPTQPLHSTLTAGLDSFGAAVAGDPIDKTRPDGTLARWLGVSGRNCLQLVQRRPAKGTAEMADREIDPDCAVMQRWPALPVPFGKPALGPETVELLEIMPALSRQVVLWHLVHIGVKAVGLCSEASYFVSEILGKHL